MEKAVYVKITPTKMRAELRALAHGKKPRIPVDILADYILTYCAKSGGATHPRPQDDSIAFLKRLYALEDPRDN